jgi:putative redox protein
MVSMSAVYQGDKHCQLTHGPSQSQIETDAPKDNQGRGEKFSPTDLVGAAFATCVLTTMAIVAERDGLDIRGATGEVEKHMNLNPRRIGKLPLKIKMPAGIPQEFRKKLQHVAETCPVHRSLHPDVEATIDIIYPD